MTGKTTHPQIYIHLQRENTKENNLDLIQTNSLHPELTDFAPTERISRPRQEHHTSAKHATKKQKLNVRTVKNTTTEDGNTHGQPAHVVMKTLLIQSNTFSSNANPFNLKGKPYLENLKRHHNVDKSAEKMSVSYGLIVR